MNIGNKIKEIRKSNNWSQEQLASKLNVSRQTISNWELEISVPNIYQVLELCKIINLDINKVVNLSINKNVVCFNDIVNRAIEKLRYTLPTTAYEVWVKPLKFISLNSNILTLGVQYDIQREVLINQNYSSLIINELNHLFDQKIDIIEYKKI